jgi:hypothetical protein
MTCWLQCFAQPKITASRALFHAFGNVSARFTGTPSESTVRGWYAKAQPGFIFAAKVPQIITHEKVLMDCDAEAGEFLAAMDLLGEKLGPLLFQFPWFPDKPPSPATATTPVGTSRERNAETCHETHSHLTTIPIVRIGKKRPSRVAIGPSRRDVLRLLDR